MRSYVSGGLLNLMRNNKYNGVPLSAQIQKVQFVSFNGMRFKNGEP